MELALGHVRSLSGLREPLVLSMAQVPFLGTHISLAIKKLQVF